MALEQQLNQDQSYQRTIRLIRPSVVVLCGPAACGKSTFGARHFRPTQIISSDQARALVCDDERDQRFQAHAFALVHFLIERRLSINRLCVVDSTALTQPARKSLLELARKARVPCVVFLFDVPLETCIERDKARERFVGRATIERQYRLFELAKSSVRQEGFDQVFEIPDEDLERLHIEILFRPVPRAASPMAYLERRRFTPRYTPPRPGGARTSQDPTPPAQKPGAASAAEGDQTASRPAATGSAPLTTPSSSLVERQTDGKS